MIKIALIGCGRHAMNNHAPALAQYARKRPGEIQLVAACDPNLSQARQACEQFGFAEACETLDATLDDTRPDACVTAVPVPHIIATATALLERGVACSIEKPLGESLVDARRLVEIAARTATPHMVSVDRRFNPWLARGLAWAREQGPLRYVHVAMIRPGRAEPHFITWTGIHAVDAVRHICGEPKDVDVAARLVGERHVRWIHAEFTFDATPRARLDILPTAGMCEERYELFGDDFRCRVSIPIGSGATVQCWKGGRTVLVERSDPDEPPYITTGAYEETVAFVRGLHEGRLGPTVTDILPSAAICQAMLDALPAD